MPSERDVGHTAEETDLDGGFKWKGSFAYSSRSRFREEVAGPASHYTTEDQGRLLTRTASF